MLPHVKDGDWRTLRQIIQKIGGSKLGPTANVTFNSLTLIDYLTVGGDATVAGTLGVTGDASFAANVAVTGVINLGHASDTTLARVSAGDVNIEGNIIYRAGGTDVPVTDGGTGVSSLTDHGLLLGSGTSAVTVLAEASNGQLPIGSTGADPSLATLTGTAKRVTVTNGAGSITLSGPQDLDIVDTPSFVSTTLTDLTASRLVYGDADKRLGSVALGAGLDLTGSTLKCDGVLEDLDTLGASSSDGEIIVATGAGTLAWESGGTARTSLGLGAGDSPTLTGLDLTGITDGYIPYVGASGLAASSLFSDGNNAGFKVTSFDPWGWYIAQAFAFPNGCYNTARTDATPAMYTGTNSYLSGTNNRWEYHKAHFASQYIQQSGAHYYNAAVSGASAGDAITWKPLLGLTLSETVFNDGSEDIDFRVESDASTHAIFMEGSSSNVGFSVSSPQEDVHAADTVRADTFFNHNGTDGATGAITVASTTTINVAGGIITGWT